VEEGSGEDTLRSPEMMEAKKDGRGKCSNTILGCALITNGAIQIKGLHEGAGV